MRVLVTGAAGQLGREVVAACSPDHDVIGLDRDALDVGDRDAVLQAIGHVQPDAIVHAAAWTDVDGCEGDHDRAFRVNALACRHVAEGARAIGARVVYVSTDYVFDGTSTEPYTEWDSPAPASVYGRSKLGGERELLALLGPDATIVRTSWLFGVHGRNFVKTVLARARGGDELAVVDDQHGCPTSVVDLAGAIRHLAVARRPGVFHVTNQGATTWYRFARDIVEVAGIDAVVRPISTGGLDPPRPAPRPANSVLDNAAWRLSGLPLLPDHHEALERVVKELSL